MERNDLLLELHARMERYRTARAALRRAAEGDDTTALDAKVRADCTVPQQLHHAWQEALPPLLTQSELFVREFSRQQTALNDLSRLCARAARLRRFGEYLRDRLHQARAALDGLNAAEGPAAQYQANARLASAVDALYQQLVPVAEKEDKADTLQTQWSEFLSRQDIIQHDGYNEAAQAFNETLGGFPAVLLGGIWQIEKVELFA